MIDGYEVRKVDRSQCADLVLKTHYAKRWPSVSFAFGLFLNGDMVGCVTYGTPPSSTMRKGVAGDDMKSHVLELNRLVLSENRKNEASMLVSRSLKMLGGNFIVVSFADTSMGHTGTVYQACNFKYHGLSAKRTDWKVKGLEHLHGITIADKFRGEVSRAKAAREFYGDDFYLLDRPRKHRYIIVIGSKGFRSKTSKIIKYKTEEYPKH